MLQVKDTGNTANTRIDAGVTPGTQHTTQAPESDLNTKRPQLPARPRIIHHGSARTTSTAAGLNKTAWAASHNRRTMTRLQEG